MIKIYYMKFSQKQIKQGNHEVRSGSEGEIQCIYA